MSHNLLASSQYAVSGTDPLLGRVLESRYQLLRQIGQGGVGVVYLARDQHERRDVVVKLLSEGLLCDADAVARFRREAEKLSSTRHPNIVSMFGLGQDERRIYMVMEYVRGVLLHEYVGARGGRLSLQEFVPIAAQILKGMGHAHSREMMLRDIKPSNIMLCERKGRSNFVKILDFGLAKQLREEIQITGEHVMGTAGYLAPEAVRGEQPDLRVDVYAVGVLFYFMLSGRLPFEAATTASVFYKTVHDPVPDLSDSLPPGHGIPEGVLALVRDCLEKDPDSRPPDANAVVERLIDSASASLFRLPSAVSGTAVHPSYGNTGMFSLIGKAAPDPASEQQGAPTASIRPRLAVLAAGAVLLLAGGAVAGVLSARPDPVPLQSAFAVSTVGVPVVPPARAESEPPRLADPPEPQPAYEAADPAAVHLATEAEPRPRRGARVRARSRKQAPTATVAAAEPPPEPLVEPSPTPKAAPMLADPSPPEPAPRNDGLLSADRDRSRDRSKALLPTRQD